MLVIFLLALLVTIATYRLTRLVTADAFPPLAAFREWVPRRFGDESSWAYLVECPWCVSIYIGAALVALVDWQANDPVPLPGLLWLVASAVTGLIASVEP